jgi:ABC-type transport system involved in Fe-S cluster assembly fused permease/ATPase subunit
MLSVRIFAIIWGPRNNSVSIKKVFRESRDILKKTLQSFAKAIETLIAQRTSIIIAHRLSTIMHAHKILVMQRGEVMESGSPEDLLKNEEGLFRKLHDMQFIQIESMATST